jgi:hypothetical protein
VDERVGGERSNGGRSETYASGTSNRSVESSAVDSVLEHSLYAVSSAHSSSTSSVSIIIQ